MRQPEPRQIGVFEAKTHFSSLIDDAIAGKTTVITKHGKPVARIVPTEETEAARIDEALERLRALRGKWVLEPGETIRDFINAGRRYVGEDDEF